MNDCEFTPWSDPLRNPEPARGSQLTLALRDPNPSVTTSGSPRSGDNLDILESTLTLILAGGRGERLQPLTACCAKPAVPFANKRIIDYTLANCARSQLEEIVVLAQHLDESVREHIETTWCERMPTLSVLSAQQVGRRYRGTADAVRAALTRYADGQRVLVLAGDHIYHMDYRNLATDHRAPRADVTIGMVPVPRSVAQRFGCIQIDPQGFVRNFQEKPKVPPTMPEKPGFTLASMGIYLFQRSVLETFLYEHPDADDFGHDVIPGMLADGARIAGHLFVAEGEPCYWRDISDVDAYHAAHMDLVCGRCDGKSWMEGASRIGPHSTVADDTLDRCVLGESVRIGPHAEVSESILLDHVVVESGARLRRVIVEEGLRIPASARIGFDPVADQRWGSVTDGGVTVVTRAAPLSDAPHSKPRKITIDVGRQTSDV